MQTSVLCERKKKVLNAVTFEIGIKVDVFLRRGTCPTVNVVWQR